MVSPEMEVLSVFMTPWMKPRSIHCATRRAWRAMTPSRNARYGLRRLRGFGVVAGDGVVGERAEGFGVAARGEVLEGADAEMAGGDAGEDGAGLDGLADDAAGPW